MQNLNVLKTSLAQATISANTQTASIDVTGCGGLAYQLVISAASGISGGSVTLQKSLDNENWVSDGDAVTVSGNGALAIIEAAQPLGGNFYRLAFALSGGSFTVNGHVLGKTFGGSSGTTTGGGGGGGSGTVTSVAMSVPSALLAVSGSPVTSSGTLAVSLPTRAANLVFSGPGTGADATPTFRSLVAADIPSLPASIITSGTLAVARGGTNLGSYTTGDILYASGATTLAKLALGTTTQMLRVNAGATALEYFSTLAVGNGGTGLATYTAGDILYATGATTLAKLAIGTATQQLRVNAGATALEYFTASGGGDFSGPGSSTDNAIVRFDGTGGKTGQNSAITIADTTGAMTWPAAAVHRSIYIPGGTLTTAADNFIELNGTFNTAGANYGTNAVWTTSGSSASSQYFGHRERLAAGYTGTGWVVGHIVQNLVAGTGTDTFGSGNVGYYGFVTGSTTGTNTSFAAVPSNGARNIGFAVAMDSPPSSTTGRNIGLYSSIDPGNNASQRNCCAFLTLTSSASSSTAPPQTGALVVSNGSSAFDTIAGYDNTTKVFAIKDGGGLCLANSASATTPGNVVKKIEIFDTAGTSLGFMALYDAIT